MIQTMLGALVGGCFALVATWCALRGQFRLQHKEWLRRDREREDDKARREKRESDDNQRAETAAMQALALEALSNSIALAIFTRTAAFGCNVVAEVSRFQYEASLPLIARRLSPPNLQQIVTVYMSAFRFNQIRAARGRNVVAGAPVIGKKELDEASNLSRLFMIAFRILALDVFSREQLDVFEQERLMAEPPHPRP